MELYRWIRELYQEFGNKLPKSLTEEEKDIKLERLLEIASVRYTVEELNGQRKYYRRRGPEKKY
jgi:hypothetical protein